MDEELTAVRVLKLGADHLKSQRSHSMAGIQPLCPPFLPCQIFSRFFLRPRMKCTIKHLMLSMRELCSSLPTTKHTPFDSTSLQSQLIRCGANYKAWMYRTLDILHQRSLKARAKLPIADVQSKEGRHFGAKLS